MWPFLPSRWSAPVRALALVVLALALATYVWWPMIEAFPHTVDLDARYGFHQWEVAKQALLRFHEYPLWNPFDCRGLPQFDHPEGMTNSPILLASTWLSSTHTVWVWNITHCAAGFVSMWLLARREVGLSRSAAFVAASMWAFAVSHTSQYAGAHMTLEDFWLAPLLLLLWRRAEHDVRAGVLAGVVVAFMVYEGATYPLPYTVLVVGLETLTRLTSVRRALRVAGAGLVTGTTAIGLSAARLLPLYDRLSGQKREPFLDYDMGARRYTLEQMFLWREGHWSNHLPQQQYVWGEYVAYVGVLALALAALGLLVSLREKRWLVFLGVVTFLLMLGHFAPWSPWSVLHAHVFPFKSMRVPSRFRLLLQMFLALWVALAVDRLPRWIDAWTARRVGAPPHLGARVHAMLLGTALLAAGDAMGLARDIVGWMHQGPAEQVATLASPTFYYGGSGLADFLDQPKQNRAWLGCRSYEWHGYDDAPLWQGDVPQARAADASAQVLAVTRTYQTFTVDVEAKAPARVILNGGYADGWQSNVGTVVEHEKLLAVDLPAGTHHVQLRYWPRLLTRGIRISLVTALGLLVFFAWGPTRRALARRAREKLSPPSDPSSRGATR